jgi:hypothetical protein
VWNFVISKHSRSVLPVTLLGQARDRGPVVGLYGDMPVPAFAEVRAFPLGGA